MLQKNKEKGNKVQNREQENDLMRSKKKEQ